MNMPPDEYPLEAKLDHIENNNTVREIIDGIADGLGLDEIDRSIGSTHPSKRGLAQILLGTTNDVEGD